MSIMELPEWRANWRPKDDDAPPPPKPPRKRVTITCPLDLKARKLLKPYKRGNKK